MNMIADSLQSLDVQITQAMYTIIASIDQGELVGIAKVSHRGVRGAWIAELFVRDDHRGRGVGTSLIDRACSIAGESGCEAIALCVEKGGDAEGLMAFYRKLGFTLAWETDEGFVMSRSADQVTEAEVVHAFEDD